MFHLKSLEAAGGNHLALAEKRKLFGICQRPNDTVYMVFCTFPVKGQKTLLGECQLPPLHTDQTTLQMRFPTLVVLQPRKPCSHSTEYTC